MDSLKHLAEQQREEAKKLRRPIAFVIRDIGDDPEIAFIFDRTVSRESLEATHRFMFDAVDNMIEHSN